MATVTRESLIADTRQVLAGALKQRDGKTVNEAIDLLQRLGCRETTEQDIDAIRLLAELDAVPTALYRHFDHEGRLLYIGVSMTITGRTAQHETYAPWFRDIDNIKLEWFGSRSSALRAEKHAITTEKPLHNVTYNKGSNNAAQERKTRTLRPRTGKRRERKPSL
jgi:predicted GIY-YIG superfamily endonuclease